LPVHEILLVDDDMRDMILKNAGLKELTELARKKGMLSMKEDGILKVLANETTLEEVHRVTMVMAERDESTPDESISNEAAVPNSPDQAA